MIKVFINKTLVPLIKYLKRKTDTKDSTRVLDEVSKRIARNTVDYIESNMTASLICQKRELLWDYVFSKSSIDGMIMEFGVSEGKSINYFSNLVNNKIYGFDSFEGLKEDWAGSGYVKGHFTRNGELPKVNKNVELIKGWFDESLPKFLETHSGTIKILHVDSDTYQAAKTVLDLLEDRLISGTIIIFDEYFGYLGWKEGEHKAFQELINAKNMKYKYMGFSETSVAVEII